MDAERIIIIEDDHDLRQQMVDFLSLSGYSVVGVGSAAELYRCMAVQSFDILSIDIRLPGEDGLSIAAHVRAHGDTAIIMVTAKSSFDVRLQAKDAGADVFLPKPVVFSELVEAIDSLLRRRQASALAAEAAKPAPKTAEWTLNCQGFTLEAPDGVEIPLTTTEMSLLIRLCSPCQVVAPRGALLEVMGYDPSDPSNRNLDAALRRLRIKTSKLSSRTLPLRTVHSVGYVLTKDVAVVAD